jgi:Gnt-I system high-affinity gluconate transporter
MSLLIVAAALAALVAMVAWAKIHPFLAFVIVSGAAGVALTMLPPDPTATRPFLAGDVPAAIKKGIGAILGDLLIVIVSGAMLGKLVVESGAAQKIASVLVTVCGRNRMSWAMALTGFVVGIPLFYGVGFVLLVPIIFAVTGRYGLPPLVVGLPALAAMSVAHGLLPTHPAPTALVAQFHADMGKTLLYGFLISIPAIVLAGPVFARSLSRIQARPLAAFAAKTLPEESLPSAAVSFVAALLPAILLLVASLAQAATSQELLATPAVAQTLRFVSDPDVVMLVALAFATVTLGLGRGRSLADVMGIYGTAIADVASTLLVIAGSGAFKQVLVQSGVDKAIAGSLEGVPLDPLVLAWLVTAAIRVCVGSATVAGLTAAGIVGPLVAAGGADPNLMVLAIGSGSLVASHVNDAAFWLFKEYFNVSIGDTLRSWTVMETIVAVVGLAGVLVLDRFV